MKLYFEKQRCAYNTVSVSRKRKGWRIPYPFAAIFYYNNAVDLLRHKTVGNHTTSYFEHFKSWDELIVKHPCLAEARSVANA